MAHIDHTANQQPRLGYFAISSLRGWVVPPNSCTGVSISGSNARFKRRASNSNLSVKSAATSSDQRTSSA